VNKRLQSVMNGQRKNTCSYLASCRAPPFDLYLITTLLISKKICSLCVIIDRCETFKSHIAAVVKSCNYHLWMLQQIRRLLPVSPAQTLACSLTLARLDCCNVVLYGYTAAVVKRLQCAQNYAVHTVTPVHTITAAVAVLYWLPVQYNSDWSTTSHQPHTKSHKNVDASISE